MNTIYAVNQKLNKDGVFDGLSDLVAIDTTMGEHRGEHRQVPLAGGRIGQRGLGISADGRFIYSVQDEAPYPIIVYDTLNRQRREIPTDLKNSISRGAVSPVTGVLYLSDIDGKIYAFDTKSDQIIGWVGALIPDKSGGGSEGDFAFDGKGTMYVTSGNALYRVDQELPTTVPTTGVDTPIPMTTLTVMSENPKETKVVDSTAIAFASDGYLYLGSGSTVYKVDPNNGRTLDNFDLKDYYPTDLASCALPNRLSLQQDIRGRIQPGDQFVASITGSGVSSGNTATTTGTATGIQPEVAGPVLAVPKHEYTITQTATGTTDLANYTTTWQCVDTNNADVKIAEGTGTTGSFEYPKPANSKGANVQCVFTTTPKSRSFDVIKTVDKDKAAPGETVDYTLTVRNTGEVAYTEDAPARVTDDLSQVLDDATYNDALTDVGNLAFDKPTNQLSWHGPLPVGQKVEIRYRVTVKADDARGDSLLKNVVTGGRNCPENNPSKECQTTTGVSSVQVAKSVEPGSGTAVVAGQDLTYTLRWENKGTAVGSVNQVDDLTGVLDDAEVTKLPMASDPALRVSEIKDGKFTVTGGLRPGQTVTVTYTVKVKAADRGDSVLENFLLGPSQDRPQRCALDAPDCTSNPVATPRPRKRRSIPEGMARAAEPNAAPAITSDSAPDVSEVKENKFTVNDEFQAGQTATGTNGPVEPDPVGSAPVEPDPVGSAPVEPDPVGSAPIESQPTELSATLDTEVLETTGARDRLLLLLSGWLLIALGAGALLMVMRRRSGHAE